MFSHEKLNVYHRARRPDATRTETLLTLFTGIDEVFDEVPDEVFDEVEW